MKKIISIMAIIIILIITIIFTKTYYKSSKYGNNITNKSTKEVEEYILNMKSYEAVAEIIIDSNKNTNEYTVKQQYIKEKNLFKQEIIEPSNIEGTSFTYDGSTLKLENKKTNQTKIYENYPYIANNNLSLGSFIEDYLGSSESRCYEEGNLIILEAKIMNGNKYNFLKKLSINKELGKIEKLEIQDIAQKTLVYILYNEIKINNLQEEMVAFSLENVDSDI